MKSAYQFDSAQEMNSEIVEAIKIAFGNKPIKITIESLDKTRNKNNNSNQNSNQFKTEIAESVIDIIFDQLSKNSKTK